MRVKPSNADALSCGYVLFIYVGAIEDSSILTISSTVRMLQACVNVNV